MNKSHANTEKARSANPSQEARASRWLFLRRPPSLLDTLFGRLDPSLKIVKPYIKKGQVIADIGCGWGYYSLALAEMVGAEGKVFAVDIEQRCIRVVTNKAKKRKLHQVETRASTAADLNFISDGSVDFVFANGLLCSMSQDRQLAVSEMKRILKPTGLAYLSVGSPGFLSYIEQPEWEDILAGFTVVRGGGEKEWWAILSL